MSVLSFEIRQDHVVNLGKKNAFSHYEFFESDGLTVPVISPASLLKNKKATGRVKDQPDVLELEAYLSEKSNDPNRL